MPISIEQNDGFVSITASGGQTNLDFDFPIYEKSHLQIIRTRSGTETTLALNTDYTIADGELEQEAGGTAVLTSGATAGDIYTMLLNVPESRTSDFNQAGDFLADTLNRELDLQTQITQQLRRDVDKSARLSDTSTLTSLEFPSPSSNKLVGWNAAATGLENKTAVDFGAVTVTGDLVGTTDTQTLTNKTLSSPILTTPSITGAMNFGTGSRIQADDSAGVGAPAISFDGDTDTGFYRIGANRIGVALGGTVGLDMIGAASAVNWFEYNNSATGSPPYFIAKGSDTNIDFRVEAKGTGVLRCESSYTNTSSGAPNVVINSSGQIQRSTVALNSASLLGAATYTTNTTLSTTIPADDTIPQNTEGTEIMTVSVTPSSASKTLIIMWNIQASLGTGTSTLIAPLFVDSTANALAVAYERPGNNAIPVAIFGIHSLSAGSTSTRTYKVRLGADAGDVYPNGTAGASRLFGSISACSIRVFEI